MGTARNILVTVVSAAVFLSVAGYHAAAFLVPGCEAPTKSTLEGRDYQTFPKISPKTLSKGTFQKKFEQFVADAVPDRDDILLENASLQRSVIEAANLPFGFEAYATFYGSGHLYYPSAQAVYEMPAAKTKKTSKLFTKVLRRTARTMEATSSLNWGFYLIDRADTSAANPGAALSGNNGSYDEYLAAIEKKVPESCTVFNAAYASTDSFLQDYFLTDHHWQVSGAAKAYSTICQAFGREPVELSHFYTATDQPFWGSNSRDGLLATPQGDTTLDVTYDNSSLTVTGDGQELPQYYLSDSFAMDGGASYTKSSKFEAVYANWYHHSEYGVLQITNESLPETAGTLMIVGDSYSNCMDRFFAQNYRTVYVVDARFYKESLQTFVSTHSVDDAIVLMCESTYATKDVAKLMK